MESDEERKARQREYSRKWRETHREQKRESSRKWHADNPEYKRKWAEDNAEKVAQSKREWAERNPEAHKAWRDANPEHVRQQAAKWREDNPEKSRDIRRRNEHRRRAETASVESEDFSDAEMLEFWGTDCHICGEPIDLDAPRATGAPGWERGLHREHVIGLVNGGSNTLANCKPAHGICNLRKPKKAGTVVLTTKEGRDEKCTEADDRGHPDQS